MGIKLLVDSGEFWRALREDVLSAREEVFVQALSFEGDSVGRRLAGLLQAARAQDRRMLVDSFSRFRVSDKFVHSPRHLFNRSLRREMRETVRALREMAEGGIGVRFTNPLGPFFRRFAARNHKKLVAIDGRVAYIGGINFSEHNFAWHDVMLRIDEADIGSLLRKDFLATWEGRNLGASRSFARAELHLFDGVSNEARFEAVLGRLASAREEVYVDCPYVTSPFCERLAEARRRGVRVTIITPESNNWRLGQEHALWLAQRAGIEVRLYGGGMTHLKTMLIDGEALIVGSANFDLWSYHFQQEILAVLTDGPLVAEFRERVIEADLARSRPCDRPVGELRGRARTLQLKLLERLSLFMSGATGQRAPSESAIMIEWDPEP